MNFFRITIFSLFLFSLLPSVPVEVKAACETGAECPAPYTEFVSPIALIFGSVAGSTDVQFSIFPFLGIAISFFIASVITYGWDKFLSGKKILFANLLKISKSKVIFASIGWVSITPYAFSYLSGLYRGTSNFPPFLSFLHNVSEILVYILLPFTFVTYILSYLDTALLILFQLVTRLRIEIGAVGNQEQLGAFAAIVIFFLLIMEWYIISSVIASSSNKFLKRNLHENARS